MDTVLSQCCNGICTKQYTWYDTLHQHSLCTHTHFDRVGGKDMIMIVMEQASPYIRIETNKMMNSY